MDDTDTVVIEVTGQEFNTILAALRYYQQQGLGDPCNRPLGIHEIAVNGDPWDHTSLDDEGIDSLCIKLNVPMSEQETRS